MDTLEKKAESLRSCALEAHDMAYSPYSKIRVGSSLAAENGKIFSGCNIENSSYGNTICAERVAFFKAISQGERKFARIYILTKDGWPPCGACRQVMSEFCGPDFEVIIGDLSGNEKAYKLKELFPLSFNPQHLSNKPC